MSSGPPSSPSSPSTPGPTSPLQPEKWLPPPGKENIRDKLGTWKSGTMSLARRRKDKEDQEELEIIADNLRSDLTPSTKKSFAAFHPSDYQLEEGEERAYLDPRSLAEPAVKEVLEALLEWLNVSLGDIETRVRITDLEDDLRDGLIFKMLMEKLSCSVLSLPCGDIVSSKERQRINLEFMIRHIEEVVGHEGGPRPWSVQSVQSGDLYSIVSLLVVILHHYRKLGSPVPDLPKTVKVTLLRMIKKNGGIQYERKAVNLMGEEEPGKRDGFDTLIDHTPEKLHFVKQSLMKFVNSHLETIGYGVKSLENDFSDGVRLCLLIGSLEGYFIPLYSYKPKPVTSEDKMANVHLAFRLMEEAGIPKPRNRPSEIVNKDLKATLRVVYSLFIQYKSA